jgi:hypothetical protein
MLYSLYNWHRLAMDACGCTDRVSLLCAGHAERIEETQNQKKEVLVLLMC